MKTECRNTLFSGNTFSSAWDNKYAEVKNMNAMDLSKGAALGLIAGLAVGMIVAADKKTKRKVVRAAKKSVDAMEDAVKTAVNMDC